MHWDFIGQCQLLSNWYGLKGDKWRYRDKVIQKFASASIMIMMNIYVIVFSI
jgi:hypothetical protein